MSLSKFFDMKKYNATITSELLGGLTTFLSMLYILVVNQSILGAVADIPVAGLFAATALTTIVCNLLMALVARAPVAMAPGMGLNTFFAYTICAEIGFTWQEALAITFIAGLIHVALMLTNVRTAIIAAVPQSLKSAMAVGIGLFIAFLGLKNAGFLDYTIEAGHFVELSPVTIRGDSSTVPSFLTEFTPAVLVSLAGLVIMIGMLAAEHHTGTLFAALPVGVLAATFIGVPLGVTNFDQVPSAIDLSVLYHAGDLFMSFFGRPGLLSLFDNPGKFLLAFFCIMSLLITNVLDSVATLIGLGKVKGTAANSEEKNFGKVLIVNAAGGVISSVFGSSASTSYIESATGFASGAKTGLSTLAVSFLFMLCLPFSGFFSLVPAAALAPALIIAGSYLAFNAADIRWGDLRESLPAFLMILVMPAGYSTASGASLGILAYVLIQMFTGQARRVPVMLYIVTFFFIAITVGPHLLTFG